MLYEHVTLYKCWLLIFEERGKRFGERAKRFGYRKNKR